MEKAREMALQNFLLEKGSMVMDAETVLEVCEFVLMFRFEEMKAIYPKDCITGEILRIMETWLKEEIQEMRKD